MFFSSLPSLSVTDAAKAVKQPNAVFIDVRTAAEYASGHAKGAENVPLDVLREGDVSGLQEYDAVYVICQSGGRSSSATTLLIAAGVKAVNVSGGTTAWSASGLPMA